MFSSYGNRWVVHLSAMLKKLLPLFIISTVWACIIYAFIFFGNIDFTPAAIPVKSTAVKLPNAVWYRKVTDIPPPDGYTILSEQKTSFGNYLQQLPLKKDPMVYLFNGDKKKNQAAQFAVINISVGKENLQQCADAVMRLWAEYWWERGEAGNIFFKDNNGKKYKTTNNVSRTQFDRFLSSVFGMCGSYSLSQQLKTVPFKEMKIGDVLIRGGFPGHAVIVVNMAENKLSKKRVYMLAQSYMPAQDIHILRNYLQPEIPWYNLNDESIIYTPEYVFKNVELKRFL